MDQGGQVRAVVDAALVPALPRQRGSATALRAGLQPCQLPPPTGATASNQTLVVDDASREAHQGRGPDCPACPVRHLSDGGGGDAEGAVRADPRTHCPSHARVRHRVVLNERNFVSLWSPNPDALRASLIIHGALRARTRLESSRKPDSDSVSRRATTMTPPGRRFLGYRWAPRRLSGRCRFWESTRAGLVTWWDLKRNGNDTWLESEVEQE